MLRRDAWLEKMGKDHAGERDSDNCIAMECEGETAGVAVRSGRLPVQERGFSSGQASPCAMGGLFLMHIREGTRVLDHTSRCMNEMAGWCLLFPLAF